ncbi:hypothetical protein HUJ04_013332 [Dendroctonus ponderosae]|nr:hypothetical protein HUJ04_013332 [Dendroctonus ponderosae]
MQTLRKKTSPLKFKNETTKFLGDGVSFKAKLIGILEVSEARGDRMCQEALCDLKMAIRAAGEHKQRITINIAIDGLRLRDEKTGDCLYHHPVHKISFIAQDMTDSRAFGYIFGSPDTGHRFFGIKTDKAASQVVIAMRDLFQVVFALKKKEIELAKQHLEKSYLPTSPLFSDSPNSVSKPSEKSKNEPKGSASASESKNSGTAVADLVDLELELNSLQQGLNQMERITPSDPFGSKDDPFGDSFISYPVNKLILPPPPSSGRDRSSRTSEGSSTMSATKTPPNTAASVDSASDSLFSGKSNKDFSFSHDFSTSHDEHTSGDWFNPSFDSNIFEEPTALVAAEPLKDEKHEAAKQEIMSQFDVFTELDPLELKNPPKKPLKELASTNSSAAQDLFNINFNQPSATTKPPIYSNTAMFASDPFGEDPFVREDPFADSDFSKQDPFETEFATQQASKELQVLIQNNLSKPAMLRSSPKTVQFSNTNNFGSFASDTAIALQAQSVEISSESESIPEPPPPRPHSTLGEIQPPPLPPKKQSDIVLKPPPRPPHSEDYIEAFEKDLPDEKNSSPPLPVPQRKSKFESDFTLPPERPRKANQQSSDEDYLTPVSFPDRSNSPGILLPPPQRHEKDEPDGSKTFATSNEGLSNSLDGLDMTLSQLTLSGLNELAAKLKIPPHKLSNMTLVQLTNYLSTFIKAQSTLQANETSETPTFQADFAANFNNTSKSSKSEPSYDRYAVFRELQEEIKQTRVDAEPEELRAGKEVPEAPNDAPVDDDKYAALREIVEVEIKQADGEKGEASRSEAAKLDEEQTLAQLVEDINVANKERTVQEPPKQTIMEYMNDRTGATPDKSPARSPVMKSPVPSAITEIIQANARLTSGSLSDVLRESWAIFDQPSVPSESKEIQGAAQSEEGVSPWSSDSKEFGNRSPTEWKKEPKSVERRKKNRDQEGWWDTSADPEAPYYPSNRRSTDSYEEEYYDTHERPRRRRQTGWQHGSQQTTGGHSSSSRDVSPWEEEPRRREGRPGWGRHPRGHSFDRHRDVKHVDSWDEDDDYEYDEEHRGRSHYFQRHGSKDSERHSSAGSRDLEGDRWEDYGGEYGLERRHRRRREGGAKEGKERWCCPDWEEGEHDKTGRYLQRRANVPERRERYDERYRSSRESQDSPWEDEYSNDPEDTHSHYLAAKKSWKQRPSSASEMDRKTGEIKPRHYLGTGGSDGERDRRYKGSRRSRSRDSQYSEPSHRHKPDSAVLRSQHRSKPHKTVEGEYADVNLKKLPPDGEIGNKKLPTGRKRPGKEPAGVKDEPPANTFPRKVATRTKSLFDNDFIPSDESYWNRKKALMMGFSGLRQQSLGIFDKSQLRLEKSFKSEAFQESKLSPRYHPKPRSPFEDDFSPSEKPDSVPEGNGISSIKEETDVPEEDEDSFGPPSVKMISSSRKKMLNKSRLSARRNDVNMKKSGSVNIFTRENDPFDDDFFSGVNAEEGASIQRSTELRWTEEFDDSDSVMTTD